MMMMKAVFFDLDETLCDGRKAWSVAPAEAAFVGDSVQNDVVGANRAGLEAILIDRSNQLPSNGDGEAQPAHRIAELREIPGILRGGHASTGDVGCS